MTQANELNHLLKMAKARKLRWVGGYNPFSLFVLGVMVFHRFALVHRRVGIQGTKYSCGSHYVEKKFVACKIATTYGEDLSLEGGVVLYNTSTLI